MSAPQPSKPKSLIPRRGQGAWNSAAAVLFWLSRCDRLRSARRRLCDRQARPRGIHLWQRSCLRRPVDPSVILPLFLLTVAALDMHMAENIWRGSVRHESTVHIMDRAFVPADLRLRRALPLRP